MVEAARGLFFGRFFGWCFVLSRRVAVAVFDTSMLAEFRAARRATRSGANTPPSCRPADPKTHGPADPRTCGPARCVR
jgi:hypothetical protein